MKISLKWYFSSIELLGITMAFNLSSLEQVIEHDADNLDQLQYWYKQLIEVCRVFRIICWPSFKYELEGNESQKDVEIIFRAMKWIMQYEHASVEELKEIAEKEAIDMAEKEENWEQEKDILKVYFYLALVAILMDF